MHVLKTLEFPMLLLKAPKIVDMNSLFNLAPFLRVLFLFKTHPIKPLVNSIKHHSSAIKLPRWNFINKKNMYGKL